MREERARPAARPPSLSLYPNSIEEVGCSKTSGMFERVSRLFLTSNQPVTILHAVSGYSGRVAHCLARFLRVAGLWGVRWFTSLAAALLSYYGESLAVFCCSAFLMMRKDDFVPAPASNQTVEVSGGRVSGAAA